MRIDWEVVLIVLTMAGLCFLLFLVLILPFRVMVH